MGAQLVSAALNPHWAQLTHFQHRVLVVMAQTALDASARGRERALYWAGRDYIALCIFGTSDPTRSQLDMISRALAALVDAGAVERVESATGHRRSRYRLVLDQFRLPKPPEDEAPLGSTTDAAYVPDDTGSRQHSESYLNTTPDAAYFPSRQHKTLQVGSTVSAAEGTNKEPNKLEELTGGDIHHLSAQPDLGARASVLSMEKCVICGRPEKQCRRLAEKHGEHAFTPRETA